MCVCVLNVLFKYKQSIHLWDIKSECKKSQPPTQENLFWRCLKKPQPLDFNCVWFQTIVLHPIKPASHSLASQLRKPQNTSVSPNCCTQSWEGQFSRSPGEQYRMLTQAPVSWHSVQSIQASCKNADKESIVCLREPHAQDSHCSAEGFQAARPTYSLWRSSYIPQCASSKHDRK